MSSRARMIILTTAGEKWLAIAKNLVVNPRVVMKWRKRFVAYGVNGLLDKPRSGGSHKYDEETEKRVLSLLSQKPLSGFSRWNRALISTELGDVTSHQVWRIMGKNGISVGHWHANSNILQRFALKRNNSCYYNILIIGKNEVSN